jgi:hypothetical protein
LSKACDASWITSERWILVGIGVATILLELWMFVEAALLMPRVRGVLEPTAPELAQAKIPASM